MALFVAICDDEGRICAEIENVLIKIFGKLNIKYEIDAYFTGEELCARLRSGAAYDLIFLDIEFAKNAINGVEVGRVIRDTLKDNIVSIVYISWEMKYSMQLFDIRPFNFLVKPLEQERIEQVVKTYLQIHGEWSREFTYNIGHDVFKVPIKGIVCLESDKRKIILHLANGRKESFYGILKDIYEDKLKQFDFLMIHASYVVNYDYIASVKYGEVILVTDAMSLPISQNKRKEVRAAFYTITEKRRVL